MNKKQILIEEASAKNLKSLSLSIPKNRFVLISGPSGAGKSTLLKDVLHSESVRRFDWSGRIQAKKLNFKKITGLSKTYSNLKISN